MERRVRTEWPVALNRPRRTFQPQNGLSECSACLLRGNRRSSHSSARPEIFLSRHLDMSYFGPICRFMKNQDLTLEELSKRSGIEPRTLRSWVSEGLLSPPNKPGRGARYPAANADRAIAVRVLKNDHGLSLAEVRHRFMMATEDQIRSWAAASGLAAAPPGSAREYLDSIRASGAEGDAGQSSVRFTKETPDSSAGHTTSRRSRRGPPLPHSGRGADLARVERLILHLEDMLKSRAPRHSRGALWTRINVTPDLEISVRGDLDAREQVLFEQLADQLRAIMTGGTIHD